MIAFLIMAHRETQILRRLVESLSAPWCRFYIHIDRKVDIESFYSNLANSPDVNFIRDRVPVHWGGWSQVQATINLVRAAASDTAPFTRFALLSGDCYPLKDNIALRDFLFATDDEYIDVVEMPSRDWNKPLKRLTRWHFEGGYRATGIVPFCVRWVNEMARFGPPRSLVRSLGTYIPYAGNTWWILTRQAINTVLKVIDDNPRLVSFYRYSLCPDESFFHTIIGNSEHATRISPSLMYADWSARESGPCLISDAHLPMLLDAGRSPGVTRALFARKFSTENIGLLDRIDAARGTCIGRFNR